MGAKPYANSLDGVFALASGNEFSFLLLETGLVYALGRKGSGCLAEQPARDAVVPRALSTSVFGHEKVVGVAAGKTRCLAVTNSSVLLATSPEQEEALKAQIAASDAPDRTVELVTVKAFE